MGRLNKKWSSVQLAAVVAAIVLLCGVVFLVVFGEGGRLALGPCTAGREGVAEGVSGEAKELLETRNFEASPKVIGDLKAGIVDERLATTLQAITKEHRVCVNAFKEGHHFLPGVEDGPLIPAGYGDAGALFSKYTRSSTEISYCAKRGDPQARTVIGIDARLLGSSSRLVNLVQSGQTLEGFTYCTA